jgi:hypothetical protein
VEFVLMDRFKWTPAELRAISLEDGLRLLTMMSAEEKARKAKNG